MKHRSNVNENRSIGSWYVSNGCFYVIINRGGTVEKHGRVSWYKRAWLEVLDCIDRPMSLSGIREFIK